MSEDQPLPRLAATVLLLRDGTAGLELFMVVRHHQIDFASGALVFPGGKVDPSDYDARLRSLCDGGQNTDDNTHAVMVAAAREAFEECGVLLARPTGTTDGTLVSGEQAASLGERYREALEKDEIGLADIAEAEGLQIALDRLTHFAHWITPTYMPKRFDTHFYLAAAPADHILAHDGRESVDSVWITPDQALADAEAGTRTIIFPTRLNIQKIGQSPTTADAITAATTSPVVTVQPTMEKTEGGRTMRIPETAGYGGSEFHVRE